MTKRKEPWSCQRCGGLGVLSLRATPRGTICQWCFDELARAGQRWCTAGRHGASDWSPDGKMCRACQSERNASYHAAHHEQALQYSREYYATHRDELNAYNHAYYQAKRQQILEQKRTYYEKHRERIKARVRAYWPRRPAESIARARARHRQKQHIYKAAERAAAQRRKFAAWRRLIGREEAA